MIFEGSYRKVVVDTVVIEVVEVRVEVLCSGPWQRFCQVGSAVSRLPLPNIIRAPPN
jgi:hypothetical protein